MRLGEKQKDYRTLSKVLAKFDLIGLEEVMNEKGVKKVQAYLEKLTKEKWDYIISENSVGSENYREYFAFIYRKSKFSEARGLGFYKEKDENEFMREPYGAYFKAGNFDLVSRCGGDRTRLDRSRGSPHLGGIRGVRCTA